MAFPPENHLRRSECYVKYIIADFLKKKNKVDPPLASLASKEGNEIQLICDKIAKFIVPQISQVGLRVGHVPPTGHSGLGAATGYLYGLCVWLSVFHKIPLGDERITVLHVWAFDEIYGLMIGFPLLRETKARFEANDPLVCHGVERARADVLNILENNEKPQGFVHYAGGEAFGG